MSDAIKKLHDYLAESPSVVYPEDVLAYLSAIEDENARLRERGAKTLEVGTRWMAKAARFESENAKLRELCASLYEFAMSEYPDCAELNFADRLRELEVEVDE